MGIVGVPPRQVAVTGMGFVTPLGLDQATVWSNLVEGVSGAGPITLFDASPFPCRIAAEVSGFDPAAYMDRKLAHRISRYTQFALAASWMALRQSGLRPEEMEPGAVGVLVASGVGGIDEMERNQRAISDGGYMRVNPLGVPMMIANMASAVVAMEVHAGGPNYCLVSACASSGHGVGEAAEVIRRGDAVAMLAGGAEACLTPLVLAGFCRMRALTERNHEPEKASRPFDRGRDGFLFGEGSVMLVLEDMEHARARGATVLAELAGYGASSDMHHFAAPEPDGRGASRAIRMALDKAGTEPAEVGYVNAHATSTPLGDIAETRALKEVFGDRAARVPISSTKSMTGHLLGAAGAMEVAVCVLVLNRGIIPPTVNQEEPDPECDLDYVPNQARRASVSVAVSNSFGFGGHNACLVVRKAA